jgi:hypothetical protein
MPRRAARQVVKRLLTDGTVVYALRFTANGERQYATLGSSGDGWTPVMAQEQLEHELARVRTGAWMPPDAETAPAMEEDPTFHDFASRWFAAGGDEWQDKTRLDYEWQLSNHLLPFFKAHRLSQITIAEVDRYRTAKAGESARLTKAQDEWRARVEQALPALRVELAALKATKGGGHVLDLYAHRAQTRPRSQTSACSRRRRAAR